MMEREFDLDAAREERAKKRADEGWVPPVLRLGGQRYELPAEIPVEVLFRIVAGDAKGALEVLLGDLFGEFWGRGPSRDDVRVTVEWVLDTYAPGAATKAAAGKPKEG